MSERSDEAPVPAPPAWQEGLTGLAQALRFYSRLPVPVLPWEPDPHGQPDFGRIVRVLPVAGLVLGALPALALASALGLGLGPWLAAVLSVAAATGTTGAFHEDGLADTADSFGGATPERRLAIMRDSRIGTFGACALLLAFALRIGALTTLAARAGAPATCAAVLMAAPMSRVAGLVPLVFLPPARSDGASRAVGRPTPESLFLAAALAAGLALLVGLAAGLSVAAVAGSFAAAALAGWALTRLADRHVGGQTGDIAGAAQQVAEIAVLVALLIALGPVTT